MKKSILKVLYLNYFNYTHHISYIIIIKYIYGHQILHNIYLKSYLNDEFQFIVYLIRYII